MPLWGAALLAVGAFAPLGCGGGEADAETASLSQEVRDPDKPQCKNVKGTFDNVFLMGADCEGRTATCTRGNLHGDLEATYKFFFVTQTPAGDPNEPTKFDFTGESEITFPSNQQLFGDDFGDITFATGEFTTVINVVAGNGGLEDATGQIVATGAVDLVSGLGGGTYRGQLCLPKSFWKER